MKHTFIAQLKALFLIEKPIAEIVIYAEDLQWAYNDFDEEYPEWEILDVTLD